MYTYEDWRRHYRLPDAAKTRREYREYLETFQVLQVLAEGEGDSEGSGKCLSRDGYQASST